VSVEISSSTDDGEINTGVLSQLDLVQQFGAVARMIGMY
jgi:hypothetical protein